MDRYEKTIRPDHRHLSENVSYDVRMRDIIARVRCSTRSLFRIYDADETVAPAFRTKQIRSVLRFAPLSIFTSIFNATLIVLMFGDRTSSWVIALWLIGLLACMSGIRCRLGCASDGRRPVRGYRRGHSVALRCMPGFSVHCGPRRHSFSLIAAMSTQHCSSH